MLFASTRGSAPQLGFHDAFAAGLAPDGGLYIPARLPDISDILANPPNSYPDLALAFLSKFDTDHPPGRLAEIVEKSYSTFHHPDIAPLRQLDENLHVLELFHGPTLAFKDFGLQLVGNLFEDQIARTGEPINVLGATSGDTGSAAIHGLANSNGAKVFILYPKGRISPLQERQMTCTGAPNIFPIPIEGTFDDAQRIVKELFSDLEFKKSARLSAVNSINLARVLAQSIYYLHAHLQLNKSQDPKLARVFSYIVPTGNFGNIFAGWLANQMGLPAAGFQIATNRNDILYRLFTEGRYQPGTVDPSLAPSMDIQVASNFERFLYYMLHQNGPRGRRPTWPNSKSPTTLAPPQLRPRHPHRHPHHRRRNPQNHRPRPPRIQLHRRSPHRLRIQRHRPPKTHRHPLHRPPRQIPRHHRASDRPAPRTPHPRIPQRKTPPHPPAPPHLRCHPRFHPEPRRLNP